ncbi:sensor histidine kinase [Cohnella silvisoli]|uniref:Sensor histidine kinase n=1 Tax=Cohnella silvisoli TaxID=2873699 RepID=A0ABV1KUM3_9BACL|nr:sensor histidine kinase [Cohnella silvisoli]MCD9021518.1 sensor histidine kinase [Cohnella silvisoli]
MLSKPIANIAKTARYRLSAAWDKLSGISLFYKFFYGIIVIVLLVLSVSSIASYLYFQKVLERQSLDSTARLAHNINMGFADNLDQIDRIIMSIHAEADNYGNGLSMREILSSEGFGSTLEQYEALQVMQGFFQRLLNLRKDFNSLYIYVSPIKQFSYAAYGSNILDYDPKSQEWYRQTVQADGRTVIFAPHRPFQLTYNRDVISFSRVLKGISSDRMDVADGVILIDLSTEALHHIIENAGLDPKTGVLLLDKAGQVVFSESVMLAGGLNDRVMRQIRDNGPSGSFVADVDGVKYLLSYSTLQVTGWKSITLTPYTQLTQVGKNLLAFDLILGLVALGLTVMIAFLFSRKIFKPIFELKRGMKQVKQGNFGVRLAPASSDELGQLAISFNSMTSTIKSLIVENYEEQLARKNAEFNYLQSQINPHFIYNTLQIISGMASVYKAQEIHAVTKSLGKMLRYSIDLKRSTVSFREEIDNVICYMDIQKLRFRGFFDYELNIEDSVYEQTSIKLILQPIVENAIVHGIEPRAEGGRVRITGRITEDRVIIEIIDNGVGISDEQCRTLMETIGSQSKSAQAQEGSLDMGVILKKGNSIGLRNIDQRIKMIFGEQYGLTIDSIENEWTRVVMEMPIRPIHGG